MSLEHSSELDLDAEIASASERLSLAVAEKQRRKQPALQPLASDATWQKKALHFGAGAVLSAFQKSPSKTGLLFAAVLMYVGFIVTKAFK